MRVMRMKKIYLNIDWMSRSVSVSDKEGFEDWRKYLVEENADGRYPDKAEKWMRLAKRGLPLAECDAKSGYEGWYSV